MQDLHKLLLVLAGVALAIALYCRQNKEVLNTPVASTMPPMSAPATSPGTGLQPLDAEDTDFATFSGTAPQPCTTVKPFA